MRLFEGVPDDGSVDANILIEEHIQAVIHRLSMNERRDRNKLLNRHKVAYIIADRCFMRRSEVLNLRLMDIDGLHYPTIMLTDSEGSPLKSANAVRKLPLYLLLPRNELKEFQDYVQNLIDEFESNAVNSESIAQDVHKPNLGDCYLFPKDDDFLKPIPESSLFDPITEIIKQVTDDETVRKQHGRHTGINNIILLLCENVLPGCSSILFEDDTARQARMRFHALKKQNRSDRVKTPREERLHMLQSESAYRRRIRLAKRLQHELVGTTDPNRQHLWAAAMLAGHGSPGVTLGSYFHLMCWLLKYSLQSKFEMNLNTAELAKIIGVDSSTIRWRRAEFGINKADWFSTVLCTNKSFKHRWKNTHTHPTENDEINPAKQGEATITPVKSRITATQADVQSTDLASANDIVDAINQVRKHDANIDETARRYKISNLKALIDAANKMELIVGKSGYRKNRTEDLAETITNITINELYLERPLKLSKPIKSKHEYKQANLLFNALQNASQVDPEKARRFLTAYWKCHQPEKHSLLFRDTGDAQLVCQFLCDLRLPSGENAFSNNDFLWVHHYLNSDTSSSKEDQRSHWSHALKISDALIDFGDAVGKVRNTVERHGYIELAVKFEAGMLPEALNKFEIHKLKVSKRQEQHILDAKEIGITNKPKKWLKGLSIALDVAAYVLTLTTVTNMKNNNE